MSDYCLGMLGNGHGEAGKGVGGRSWERDSFGQPPVEGENAGDSCVTRDMVLIQGKGTVTSPHSTPPCPLTVGRGSVCEVGTGVRVDIVCAGCAAGCCHCQLARSHHRLAGLGCLSPQGTSPTLDFLCLSVGLLFLCPGPVTLLQIEQAVCSDRRMTIMLSVVLSDISRRYV